MISDYLKEQKESLIVLRTFKETIKGIVPVKEQEAGYYKSFVGFLQKYEDNNSKA